MKLNPSQRAVVACDDKRILVLAGAGTGKTQTSVHWVAERIRRGARRSEILMITFTRKAASEMAARVDRLTADIPRSDPSDRLCVGTYHAVSLFLMRRDAPGFGFTSKTFSTLDESEAQSLWKSALKQCGIQNGDRLHSPSKAQSLYSLARNTGQRPCEVFEEVFPGGGGELEHAAGVYEQLKAAASVVDYDDLLVRWKDRMVKDAEYAARLRSRWRWVLVDEVQDNNRLNEAVLDALDPEHLMVVGDANQSIYGFRGSDVAIVTDFLRKGRSVTVMKLEDNYRSSQAILDVANVVVAETENPLILRAARGPGGTVSPEAYRDPVHEAASVVRWMQRRIGVGTEPCQCCVIARSSKALGNVEAALAGHRIRYKKYGGLMLADAAEVKDFVAFFRVLHNPRDKVALLRVLLQFPGIGEGVAARVISGFQGDLFDEMQWPRAAGQLGRWLDELREAPTLQAKGKILQEYIKPLILANYPKDGGERMSVIETVVNSLVNDDSMSVEDFLDGFALDRESRKAHPREAVVVSTIHSAKGLEWDHVWVMGCSSAQMPHPRAQSAGEMAEERRLFYVAVTRARNELVLSYAQSDERRSKRLPTPFAPSHFVWSFGGVRIEEITAQTGRPPTLADMFKALQGGG